MNNWKPRNSNATVYSTGILEYSDYSSPVLLLPGKYKIDDNEYDTKKLSITVLKNNQSNQIGSDKNYSIMGGFYTPTNKVENNMDNDGNMHPGNLDYFRESLKKNDFHIMNEYNFIYSQCSYCPGGYCPDNKAGEHTIIIYETNQSLDIALEKLKDLVKDNVYI